MKLRLHLTFFETPKHGETEIAARRRFTFPISVPFSLILGIGMGVFFHYLLYRMSLPSHPFVYVSF